MRGSKPNQILAIKQGNDVRLLETKGHSHTHTIIINTGNATNVTHTHTHTHHRRLDSIICTTMTSPITITIASASATSSNSNGSVDVGSRTVSTIMEEGREAGKVSSTTTDTTDGGSVGDNKLSTTSPTILQQVWLKYFSGGTLVDAVLLEASQQIGQSVLTLPWIFASMGYAGGTICLIVFSAASMWTQSLLVILLTEYRHQQRHDRQAKGNLKHKSEEEGNGLDVSVNDDDDDGKHDDSTSSMHRSSSSKEACDSNLNEDDHRHQSDLNDHVASYHDVITHLAGPWWGRFSWLVVVVALIGLSTVQIISTSSNLYLLEPEGKYGKRDLSLIVGSVFAITAFIPTFRDYRVLSVLGLVATAYTAWFMTVSAALEGPNEDTEYGAPTDIRTFFTAFASLLFMFGGHTAAVEKADVMNDHSMYDIAFAYSVLYVYTITLPNGITAYHTFGIDAQEHSNAFYLFDPSVYRDVGVILMCLHEFVAFGLFCGPLYHMVEKALGIDHNGYLIRTSSRLFVVGFMLLLAVAFPFFGIINGLLGAFTTTFGTFIIPCVVYNMYYFPQDGQHQHRDQEQHRKNPTKVFPLPVNMTTIRLVNWVIIFATAVFGLGFGGWASAMTLADHTGDLGQGVFDPCYEC